MIEPTSRLSDLASFAVHPWTDELGSTWRRVGDLTVDFLGGALAGLTLAPVTRLAAAIAELEGSDDIDTWSPDRQAFLWAAAANMVDAEDTHLPTTLHLEGVVLGTLAALSRTGAITGADLVRAAAVGWDVGCAVATAEHYTNGWHSTATVGALAATAAAAALVGLDPDQAARALSAATSFASGHRHQFGTDMKAVQVGAAAAAAVQACVLARHGVDGQVSDLPPGHPGGHLGELDLSAPVAFGVGVHAVALKPYPCGVVTHCAGQAAIDLHTSLGPVPAAVDVAVSPFALALAGNDSPRDPLEARLSVAHVVAAGLVDGRLGLAQFAQERLDDPRVAALRSRVHVRPDDALGRYGASVRVGDVTVEHLVPRGSPDRPLGSDGVVEKAVGLVRDAGLSPTVIHAARDVTGRILDVTDIGGLFACLAR